jgi:phospholipid-binding lipoprotein MlaA
MKPARQIFTPIIITALLTSAWALPISGQEQNLSKETQGQNHEQYQPERTEVQETNDPLQDINRVTSAFNRTLRQWIIDPVVDGYQAITPDEVQKAISNVVSNISEPLTIASSLLQGDTENAGIATKRFIINTAAGVGGLMDIATDDGYVQRREDLGQALGAHGVEPGPHLVLPIIGPSNFRDAAGDIAMFFINPLPLPATVAAGGVEYSGKQDTVKSISDDAVDAYVAERDSYEKNRRFVVNNGERMEVPVIAEID